MSTYFKERKLLRCFHDTDSWYISEEGFWRCSECDYGEEKNKRSKYFIKKNNVKKIWKKYI